MKLYQLYIELDLISTPLVPHSCSYSHGVDVDIIVITAPPQPRGRIILHLLVSIFNSIYIYISSAHTTISCDHFLLLLSLVV